MGSGTFSVTAEATDALGKTSNRGAVFILTIDNIAPATPGAPVLADGNNGQATSNTPTITGSTEPGSTITIYDGNNVAGTTTADQSGNYSYTFNPPLNSGTHTIKVESTDGAGNISQPSSTVSITVSVSPLTVVISSAVQQSNGAFKVTFTFLRPVTAFDTADLRITNGVISDIIAAGDGVYTATISPFYNGDVSIVVKEAATRDISGNYNLVSNILKVSAGFNGRISSVYPVPANNILNIKFEGTVNEQGRVQLINLSGIIVFDKIVTLQDRKVQISIPNLSSGFYVLTFRAKDYTYQSKVTISR
jgi:hypothetical protein